MHLVTLAGVAADDTCDGLEVSAGNRSPHLLLLQTPNLRILRLQLCHQCFHLLSQTKADTAAEEKKAVIYRLLYKQYSLILANG